MREMTTLCLILKIYLEDTHGECEFLERMCNNLDVWLHVKLLVIANIGLSRLTHEVIKLQS